MRRKRRPVVFVVRIAVAGQIKRVAVALEPESRQEGIRDERGRYLDQRPVPPDWSGEASANR